jgi:hypothetical protein
MRISFFERSHFITSVECDFCYAVWSTSPSAAGANRNKKMDLDIVNIIATSRMGRSVVAKRVLQAGTCIVNEEPVACVPLSSSSIPVLCVHAGRYRISQEERSMLGPQERHHSTLQRYNSFSGTLCLLAARCYRALQNDHVALLHNHIPKEQASKIVGLHECAEITRRLIAVGGDDQIPSIDQCICIICTLACNLFTIADDFQNEAGVGCYPYAAMLNHSCDPNCIQRFDANANIVIRVVRRVEVGEELCISYTDTGMPTWYRQQELLKSYHFHCQCARCTRWDARNGYACNAATGADHRCFGTCHRSATSYYSQWLAGTGAAAKMQGIEQIASLITQQEALFLRALPHLARLLRNKEILQAVTASSNDFVCSTCGAARSEQQLSIALQDLVKAENDHRVAVKSLNGCAVPALTKEELLFVEIVRFSALLERLERLMPAHHYSILQLRKQLKSAMEQHLPVEDGILLFPTLRARSEVSNAVRRSGQSSTYSSQQVSTMPAEEVQQLYQDNLREILACTEYCYSAGTPNLCHTYFSVQYLWFVLAKHTSALDSRGARVRGLAPDNAACRELLQKFPQFARAVAVVYGSDHAFVMDVARCHGDLLRLLSS